MLPGAQKKEKNSCSRFPSVFLILIFFFISYFFCLCLFTCCTEREKEDRINSGRTLERSAEGLFRNTIQSCCSSLTRYVPLL